MTPAPRTAGPHALSTRGLELIAHFEGFSAVPYDDGGQPGLGNATIGFGHLLHLGAVTLTDRHHWNAPMSRADGLYLLRRDADIAVADVNRLVTVPLKPQEFDALVSFTFNLGGGALERSTLLTSLNHSGYASVPRSLMQYDHAGGRALEGLRRRRQAEGDVFAKGVYPS